MSTAALIPIRECGEPQRTGLRDLRKLHTGDDRCGPVAVLPIRHEHCEKSNSARHGGGKMAVHPHIRNAHAPPQKPPLPPARPCKTSQGRPAAPDRTHLDCARHRFDVDPIISALGRERLSAQPVPRCTPRPPPPDRSGSGKDLPPTNPQAPHRSPQTRP